MLVARPWGLPLQCTSPALDWARVSHYGFLEEFTLLSDTRNDICSKAWAKPVMREVLKMYRRSKRAQEELVRLNVEVRRLHTAIRDEAALFGAVQAGLRESDPLRGALADYATRRKAINDQLLTRIHQIYALPGYTGVRGPGEALHNMCLDARVTVPQTPSITTPEDIRPTDDGRREDEEDSDDDEANGGAVDEEEEHELSAICHWVADLAIS